MKWISVKEQLPEENELVFICGAMKYDHETEYEIFTDIGNLTYDGNWKCDNDWYEGQEYFQILFWKPIKWPEEPNKLTILEQIKFNEINKDFREGVKTNG